MSKAWPSADTPGPQARLADACSRPLQARPLGASGSVEPPTRTDTLAPPHRIERPAAPSGGRWGLGVATVDARPALPFGVACCHRASRGAAAWLNSPRRRSPNASMGTWRRDSGVESQTDTAATLVKGERVNHVLHLIISIVTVGSWLIVWAVLTRLGGRTYVTLQVGPAGAIHETRRRDLSGCALHALTAWIVLQITGAVLAVVFIIVAATAATQSDLTPTSPSGIRQPAGRANYADADIARRRVRLSVDHGHVPAHGDAWPRHGHYARVERNDAQAAAGRERLWSRRVWRCRRSPS